MKLRILGCGTSTGVPVPGCHCPVCTSGDPKNERLRTSALFTGDDGHSVLIDAGTDLRSQALKHGVKRVDSVLFTHSHSDHILGVDDLRCFNFIQRSTINCYGTDKTLLEIERLFSYIFNSDSDYEGGLLADLSMHRIHDYKPFSIGTTTIVPLLLWHGRMPVTGFRIGDFVYATDCNSIPEESKQIMRGAKYLFLDGLRYREHKTHFTVDEAVAISHELEAEMTYLIHMSHDIDYKSASASLPPTVQLAFDGLEITL